MSIYLYKFLDYSVDRGFWGFGNTDLDFMWECDLLKEILKSSVSRRACGLSPLLSYSEWEEWARLSKCLWDGCGAIGGRTGSHVDGSYGNFTFSFLRVLQAGFHMVTSVCILTNSEWAIPVSPIFTSIGCWLFLWSRHFDWDKMKPLILLCISLIAKNVEHLGRRILATCVSSFESSLSPTCVVSFPQCNTNVDISEKRNWGIAFIRWACTQECGAFFPISNWCGKTHPTVNVTYKLYIIII